MYDLLVIFCAKYLVFVLVAVGAAYMLWRHRTVADGMFAFASLALSYVVGKGLGLLWYDPLPFVERGTAPLFSHAANNGFPSDHMLLGAAVASIVFVYNRKLGLVLWVLALLVGGARVLAGVHHVVDIAAAACVAIVATAAASYGARRYGASR